MGDIMLKIMIIISACFRYFVLCLFIICCVLCMLGWLTHDYRTNYQRVQIK